MELVGVVISILGGALIGFGFGQWYGERRGIRETERRWSEAVTLAEAKRKRDLAG